MAVDSHHVVTADGAASDGSQTGSKDVRRLKPGAIGLSGVIFMAVATSAPITAMSGNLPVGVGFGVGGGAPATYIIVTAILFFFSVGYIAMSRKLTSTSAFYGYISHGLGRVPGLGAGYMLMVAYMGFECSLVGIFGYFAHLTLQSQLGIGIPWVVCSLAAVAANAILAYFAINLAARVLTAFLLTEISVLAITAVSILIHGGGPHGIPLSSINPVNAFGANGLTGASVGLGIFIAFWSWTGFESTAIYGEESKDPKRIIPIATMVAVLGVGFFYIFVSWMTVAGNGVPESIRLSQSAQPLNLLFAPTRHFVGGWAVTTFQWLLITGSFACGLAFHNCASRYMYSLGRERLLPPMLGRTHPRHGSPYVASGVQMVFAVLVTGGFAVVKADPYLVQFVLMALAGTFSLVIIQALVMAATIVYYRRFHPAEAHWFSTLVAPLIGGVGLLGMIYLLLTNLSAAAGPAAHTVLFHLIPWIDTGLGVGGMLWAYHLLRHRPERYAVIGRVIFDETTEAPAVDDEEPVVGVLHRSHSRTEDGHPPRQAAAPVATEMETE